MADGTKAGWKRHASLFSLPAATTTVMTEFVAWSMAVCNESGVPEPPRLKPATAGRCPEETIQSKPASSHAKEPLPLSEGTFTECTVAPGATP